MGKKRQKMMLLKKNNVEQKETPATNVM